MNVGKIIISAVLAVIILVLGYMVYNELFSPYFFTQNKEARYAAVKERMNDILTAQEAYRSLRGYYTGDFDTLAFAIKNDSLMTVTTIGSESDTVKRISVQEAVEVFDLDSNLSGNALRERIARRLETYNEQVRRTGGDAITTYVVMDTFYVPVMETISLNTSPDSLKYIPYGNGEEFILEASSIEVGAGRVVVPTYEVVVYNEQFLKDLNSDYYNKQEGIRLGALNEATTDIVDIVIRDDE